MKIVGIDYGHGETSAGYVSSEAVIGNEIRMQDLKITGEQIVIPSVICKTLHDEFVINPSVNQLAKAKEIGICFKAPLIGNEKYEQISDENKIFFREFLTKVYNSIVSNDNNPLHIDADGNMDFRVYIACPSGWDDTQVQAYKEFVQNDCNIPLIDIVKESRAAYIAARRKVGGGIRTQGGNVLVIDFGSSTIDFTYFNNDSRFEPIHEGYPYGASQVERDVLSYLINNNPEVNQNVNLVVERCGKTMAMNALLFEIRKQKEKFFSQDNPEYFNPSIHLRDLLLDRSLIGLYIEPNEENGFSKKILTEEILKTYIQKLSDMLDDFANKEEVLSIDKVILTGGASRMFFFKDLVSERYGVSKKEDTLIVDLEPSLTISEGIAAFGYMNEQATPREKGLIEVVEKWIAQELPGLLKRNIEKCIGDMYYSEFSHITYRYGEGLITKDGKHNLDGLEDEIIRLLNSWTASGEAMSDKINNAIRENMMSSIGEKIAEYARTWGYDAKNSDFNINVKLDMQASLTSDTCKNLLSYMWNKLKDFINDRDFWPFDPNTSPYRERDKEDRKSIERNLDGNFRAFFNDLNYISPLDDEIAEISHSVRNKVQEFVDNAKLQQYR